MVKSYRCEIETLKAIISELHVVQIGLQHNSVIFQPIEVTTVASAFDFKEQSGFYKMY